MFPILIKDLKGGLVFSTDAAWPSKPASRGFGKESTNREWELHTEDALPVLTSAFSSISGDKFERLMKKLLIDNKNISVESEATDGEVKLLSYDLANEVFCGDVQDMYILCFEVIRLNFKGFSRKSETDLET